MIDIEYIIECYNEWVKRFLKEIENENNNM